ncbi:MULTISPECIES: LacI family DNA-binding transcriptional regulator [Streptomyces]|uniref:LacI family transcriptional regulator n=1 Tax=Streptomyces thermoviolaceus subsp. thermoviolaceus TaxID=66860 RepID=A0ABX0YRW2_STRTL|nr:MULTISPECIES: LacI family DNA-binding transcriptional regulator [Streptomyces]MCM3262549.1 LacI family transcriptional regulator [Streptomyces thermoviolaceus]NJP14031.1 LacI family transcriptional regulator [Streptomyces thermoviolaceus subsp. thermoviolaceus]RSS00623.1 LacI family transcriptional regulator [Streptomyces sp. WAC00469]WTD50384.1 LacI family transcriptional regulator [Streptomyces thermoviolaceus]GGV63428.1 LacI family transcriptional regulator [Streptomyces thermoviolaceus 
MRAPTIRDVAARAGVSKSLVSLVLRGSGSVRPEKRQAVLAAVEELGYRPNAAARSLSERRTRTVGVLLDDLRNPWFVDLLDGLTERLHDAGLRVLLGDGRLDERLGEDLTRTFTELRVDGVVAVGTLQDPQALRAAAGRVPVVVAGAREPELPGVDVVTGDDELGARLATEHLIRLGHRRIAHITGRGAVGALRRRGFETAMRAHGLADAALVENGDLTEEGGHRAAVRLLGRTPRPTAVFAANDITCVGALSAAAESGLAVPRELSLVGYDNTSLARLRHLSLTTVDPSGHEVGLRAARRLLDRIQDPDRPGTVELTRPVLRERGSTAPPAASR